MRGMAGGNALGRKAWVSRGIGFGRAGGSWQAGGICRGQALREAEDQQPGSDISPAQQAQVPQGRQVAVKGGEAFSAQPAELVEADGRGFETPGG